MRRRFPLVGVVIGCLLASLLSACSSDSTVVSVLFEDSGDLQPRGSVQVADVRIGRIGSIHLTKDFKARVTLHINGGRRVPRNSVAILRTTSLLGEKFVELRPQGDPTRGPFLRDGDVISKVEEAPELEFVAEQAVGVLGAVTAGDVATLIDTSVTSFSGRGNDIRTLIDSLDTYSKALASRTANIGRIIDGLDQAMAPLAANADSLRGLVGDLATTTRVLAENRDQAVTTLRNLTRIASTNNPILDKYQADIEKQIHQVEGIVKVVAGQTSEITSLLDWLQRFVTALPRIIPNDFTNVFLWVVPSPLDPRAES